MKPLEAVQRSVSRRPSKAHWDASLRPEFSSFLQRAVGLFLLVVAVLGLNIHLFLFQLYGWSGMILDYRQTSESWTEAAEKTLSGEAPCGVCVQVETALWTKENPLPSLAATDEIPFQPIFFLFLVPSSKLTLPVPPPGSQAVDLPAASPAFFAMAPPAPPPRGVIG